MGGRWWVGKFIGMQAYIEKRRRFTPPALFYVGLRVFLRWRLHFCYNGPDDVILLLVVFGMQDGDAGY